MTDVCRLYRGIRVRPHGRGARLLPRRHERKLQDFKVSGETLACLFSIFFSDPSRPTCVFSWSSSYRKDQCQSPDPPASSFIPSFAAVAAGVDKNPDKDVHSKSLPPAASLTLMSLMSETQTCVFPSVPFSSHRSIFARVQIQHHRSSSLHTSTSRPCSVQQVGVSESSAAAFLRYTPPPDQSRISPLLIRFTWSGANSHCSPYAYCEEGNYIGTVPSQPDTSGWTMDAHYVCPAPVTGNGTFPGAFPSQEVQRTHCSQAGWTEEQPQESPSAWDTAACVGSKVIHDP